MLDEADIALIEVKALEEKNDTILKLVEALRDARERLEECESECESECEFLRTQNTDLQWEIDDVRRDLDELRNAD